MSEEKKIKLLVGLGNPGSKYDLTRHNIGFMLLDELAKRYGTSFQRKDRFDAQLAKCDLDGQTLYLLKPETYMNLSGLAVKKCMQFFKIKREELLVVSDDAALEFEEMRIKPKGSHGGHNGLRNIQSHLGAEYPRLRLGIGAPPSRQPLEDYVLGRFSKEELENMGAFLDDAVDAVEVWLKQGLEFAMNWANTKKD